MNVGCTEDPDHAEVAYGKIICESECTVLELAPDWSLIPSQNSSLSRQYLRLRWSWSRTDKPSTVWISCVDARVLSNPLWWCSSTVRYQGCGRTGPRSGSWFGYYLISPRSTQGAKINPKVLRPLRYGRHRQYEHRTVSGFQYHYTLIIQYTFINWRRHCKYKDKPENINCYTIGRMHGPVNMKEDASCVRSMDLVSGIDS